MKKTAGGGRNEDWTQCSAEDAYEKTGCLGRDLQPVLCMNHTHDKQRGEIIILRRIMKEVFG